MFKIVTKRVLNEAVVLMEIEAPFIAKKAQPGQFIIFRVDEHGERVPLTIADYDREKGTVTISFQIVGRSTEKLSALNEGDTILDFVGPLGVPTHIEEDAKSVCVVGGGVGCAIAYPQAKALFNKGIDTTVIAGFRTRILLFLKMNSGQQAQTSSSQQMTVLMASRALLQQHLKNLFRAERSLTKLLQSDLFL